MKILCRTFLVLICAGLVVGVVWSLARLGVIGSPAFAGAEGGWPQAGRGAAEFNPGEMPDRPEGIPSEGRGREPHSAVFWASLVKNLGVIAVIILLVNAPAWLAVRRRRKPAQAVPLR